MSEFAGQLDRYGGVMIKSADAVAQETNPVEFGPKLTSKFFAFFPLAAPPRLKDARTIARPVHWFPNAWPPTSIPKPVDGHASRIIKYYSLQLVPT